MKQTVYYRHKDGESEIAIAEDGVLERYYRLKDGFLTGSIYVGKVRRASKGTGAFVDIGEEKDGLLSYRAGIKSGDSVLVTVTKEPTESKGCALTEEISLAGRYAVLNDSGEIRFSSKLSEPRKKELKKIAEENGAGYVFRTSCEEADARAIEKECLELKKKYDSIKNEHKKTNKVKCILKDDALTVAKRFAYRDENFSENFGEIEKQTEEIGQRKIIKEGVELVFDKTEALTAVDVNLHKFGKRYGNTEETNYQANLIAVKELARQIRLRNTGGIIMVDFISLKDKEKTESLKKALSEELKKDHIKTSVELIESIGMFAIVRRKRYSEVY